MYHIFSIRSFFIIKTCIYIVCYIHISTEFQRWKIELNLYYVFLFRIFVFRAHAHTHIFISFFLFFSFSSFYFGVLYHQFYRMSANAYRHTHRHSACSFVLICACSCSFDFHSVYFVCVCVWRFHFYFCCSRISFIVRRLFFFLLLSFIGSLLKVRICAQTITRIKVVLKWINIKNRMNY